ncbi:hypothetical protein [Sphingomonas crocodyli]|uniref:Uncharacterized protein n=1 Tax=Sphingomonas crocodyli TaxID=1979270 RepID=A0A437LVL1_9SPHN|nr:hypothetical protein [Sphingomonas crocodyli]RVT89424.1 hypothetical protein EOD43_21915 [Sphingomonas crocodyli]
MPITVLLILIIVLIVVAVVAVGWVEINIPILSGTLRILRPQKSGVPDEAAVSTLPDAATIGDGELLPELQARAGQPAEAEHNSPFIEYIEAKTLSELDQKFNAFSSEIENDREFWETDYQRRRFRLGSADGSEGLKRLVRDHPQWALPSAILVELSVATHDFQAAGEHLIEGLKRETAKRFGAVLSSGLRLRFEEGGVAPAAAFAAEWCDSQVAPAAKGELLITYAGLLKDAGHEEGHLLAREWAGEICPSERANIFRLAYAYAERRGRWAAAITMYDKHIIWGDEGGVSINNRAILYGHFDKPLQISEYERAAEAGDAFAKANLAQLMISDGYLKAAEHLLLTDEAAGDAAELHAEARRQLLAARRAVADSKEETENSVSEQRRPLARSISLALRHFQRRGAFEGQFSSADGWITASLVAGNARCRARLNGTDLEGDLTFQGICYGGQISVVGQGLLSGSSYDVTLFFETTDTVRFFRWPSLNGAHAKQVEVELNRVAQLPVPAEANAALGPAADALGGLGLQARA